MNSKRTIGHGLKAAVLATVLVSGAALADPHTFLVTREDPGVQQANVANLCAALGSGTCTLGEENFNSRPIGTSSFPTDFGITTGPYSITGTYTNVEVRASGQYGGADGSGNYAVTFAGAGYTLDLSTDNPDGVNYFGFWLSALDRGNQVHFYFENELVFSFLPTDVDAIVGGSCPGNDYCANPNTGENDDEPYVFLNFFDKTGKFDRIVFLEDPEVGGYESDNHTVGYVTGDSGTPVNVPVPGTLLLSGLGLAGIAAMRRKRSA